jgi:ribosome maturation factor RimP
VPVDGRRKFVGVIGKVGQDGVELDVEGETVGIVFADIEKARLVPDI